MTKIQPHKRVAKQVKKNVKLGSKLFLFAIPVMILSSILLAMLNLESWLIILINLIVGGATCFVVYIVYDKLEQKKQDNLDKHDPFSD